MFDIGFSELLIIAVIALIVLGPEKLPRAARIAGLWVRRARSQWYAVQADLERELAQDEFRRSVGQPIEELRRALADEARALREELERPADAPADLVDTDPAPPAPRDPAP